MRAMYDQSFWDGLGELTAAEAAKVLRDMEAAEIEREREDERQRQLFLDQCRRPALPKK